MTTRYFKVLHKAGAFIDDVYYPPVTEDGDFTDSIVPLKLDADAKAPLWGVECDAQGNEIGAVPEGVKDKMSTELANQIASGAGQGKTEEPAKTEAEKPATEPDNSKEADTRKQTIIATLDLLDHANNEDWTEGGKPKVEVVAAASGLEGLTRGEITAAAPEFIRKVG